MVAFLRPHFPAVERAYGAGRPDDRGDIAGLPGVVIECKAHREIELASFMDEAIREAANFPTPAMPVLVVKRRNKGVDRAYAVMELHDWVSLYTPRDKVVTRP